MKRARRGRNPMNRFDVVKEPAEKKALNSIYLNAGFLPDSDWIKVTIESVP